MNIRYMSSVKQCIFVHPFSGTAVVLGKTGEDAFDVLWNKKVLPWHAFAMAIASIVAKTSS